ncbi:hypothetical protein Cob_v007834 [Colletotrichum orbiculare MAFF 240422]|uniref:Uncharacterized protein n=1 Tax=Colletotrichum orbiculare (strain 104-T / ATCC 96160 / CBS 514.97 / LARS 414 / MAFF 240422) TaxID=1213857 RepID=A0A484FPF7_COLOR|nr:hypothetical protein Cob_v007834 [Colletotrichum orbiculare MAFF 240422]
MRCPRPIQHLWWLSENSGRRAPYRNQTVPGPSSDQLTLSYCDVQNVQHLLTGQRTLARFVGTGMASTLLMRRQNNRRQLASPAAKSIHRGRSGAGYRDNNGLWHETSPVREVGDGKVYVRFQAFWRELMRYPAIGELVFNTRFGAIDIPPSSHLTVTELTLTAGPTGPDCQAWLHTFPPPYLIINTLSNPWSRSWLWLWLWTKAPSRALLNLHAFSILLDARSVPARRDSPSWAPTG